MDWVDVLLFIVLIILLGAVWRLDERQTQLQRELSAKQCYVIAK